MRYCRSPYVKEEKYSGSLSVYGKVSKYTKSSLFVKQDAYYSELRFCPAILQSNGGLLLQDNGYRILL